MIPAQKALELLREGNRRFVCGEVKRARLLGHQGGTEPLREPQPFAIILGCSDSRVPVEIVFDQGVGDLFVVRVAGNIATPAQIGSVEFVSMPVEN